MADTNTLGDVMRMARQNQLPDTGKLPLDESNGDFHTSLLDQLGERGKWIAGAVLVGGIAAVGGTKALDELAVASKAVRGIDRLAEAGEAAEKTIGEARVFPRPDILKIQQEHGLPADVRKLYEDSFPIEERQPTDEVHALNLEGKIRNYTVRDREGNLGGFAFVSVHDDTTLSAVTGNPPNFVHLDFFAVADQSANPLFHRSNGLGSELMKNILTDLKAENEIRVQQDLKPFDAVTLEMEDKNAKGLTPGERNFRGFRSKVYARLGAENELPGHESLDAQTGQLEYHPGYKILDFDKIGEPKTWTPLDDDQPAEFRVFWLTDPGPNRQAKALSLAETFYQSESGYDLANIQANHPALQELRRLHGQ